MTDHGTERTMKQNAAQVIIMQHRHVPYQRVHYRKPEPSAIGHQRDGLACRLLDLDGGAVLIKRRSHGKCLGCPSSPAWTLPVDSCIDCRWFGAAICFLNAQPLRNTVIVRRTLTWFVSQFGWTQSRLCSTAFIGNIMWNSLSTGQYCKQPVFTIY